MREQNKKQDKSEKPQLELDYEDLKKKLGFGKVEVEKVKEENLESKRMIDTTGLSFEGRAFIPAPVIVKVRKRVCELPPEDKTPGQF